ncbi:hypothetical protein FACS189429_0170 [Bacteroidia bacterium]|nr:hypothetical protein FACS189429_0170 [Bacteroidia bacterium]
MNIKRPKNAYCIVNEIDRQQNEKKRQTKKFLFFEKIKQRTNNKNAENLKTVTCMKIDTT